VTNDSPQPTRANGRTAVRALRMPAVVVVVYLVLWLVFAHRAEHAGLLHPSGSIDAGLALLGATVLLLRIVVLFVVSAVVTYRVVAGLLPAATKR
jgi:hypothetical protein